MIGLTKKQQVILRHLDGTSNRQIAAELGIDKNTVNKYVKEYDDQVKALLEQDPDADPDALISAIVEEPTYNAQNRTPTVSTEAVRMEIQKCLDDNELKRQTGRRKQQMRGTDIHKYLTKKGITISYSTVKRLLREMRDDSQEAFIRQEHSPGQICEFDWGEVKLNIGGTGYKKYQMAAFATAYGNYRFARLYRSQDTAAFQDSHAKFIHFCKGTYHTMVYDNMKVAVKTFVGPTEKEPTEALTQLSMYYKFNFRFCNVRRGNEKSHVERTVDVMRHYAFTNPGDDVFDSLEAANKHLLLKCYEINKEPLSDGRIPAATFAEEQPLLIAEMPPYPCFVKRNGCRVDKYSTVSLNNVRYSVPDKYTGKRLDARIYTDKIAVYDDKKIIAIHSRSFQQGSYHIDIFHYLKTLKRKPGALPQSTALLQADTQIKNIYETHYSNDPKAFLEVLEIIKDKGVEKVAAAITELLQISPTDINADKIKVVCENHPVVRNFISETGTDHLRDKIKSTLSQYDRLSEVMNACEREAV